MPGCENNEPYALRVLGDSMAPEFNEGDVLIIEPGTCMTDGAFVIAMYDGEYIFRQLRVEDNELFLNPVNNTYATVQLPDRSAVKGRIVSKSDGKGRQTKTYL